MDDALPQQLDEVPRDAEGHFRLYYHAAVCRVLYHLKRLTASDADGLQELFDSFPFLRGYYDLLHGLMPGDITWGQSSGWWERNIASWEQTAAGHLPLRALRGVDGVRFPTLLALMVVGLMEEHSGFGNLFARLHDVGQRRPSVELVGRLTDPQSDPWLLIRPLVDIGLVEMRSAGTPRSERILRVDPAFWDVIRGEPVPRSLPWCRYRAPEELRPLPDLILPDDIRSQLAHLHLLLADGTVRTTVVRGTPGSERLAVVGALARELGMGLAVIPLTDERDRFHVRLGPFCTLTRSMPVFQCDIGPGESVSLPNLEGYRAPVAATIGFDGGIESETMERAVLIDLPLPGPDLRRLHWEAALAGRPAEDLTTLSERFLLSGGHIRKVGPIAGARAALDGREAIRLSDVKEACRTLNRQLLDNLAIRLDAGGTWDDLVVSPAVRARLEELERRCRFRERILTRLGRAYVGNANRGVRALLAGPSGTGKTLAARILASVLEMDIYRVDLAAVISKYVGETEKNLSRAFARAEELDVILLLDEGDSLLGRRSEVNGANDRFANMQTNYVLQRLETYRGIALVTTNAPEAIDSAFERRLDVMVDFLPPGPAERLKIWQLHLPVDGVVDEGFLQEIAARCDLTGGQIRNAAIHAAMLTLDSGGAVSSKEVEAAVRSEYRKAGAICPLPERVGSPGSAVGLDSMLKGLTPAE